MKGIRKINPNINTVKYWNDLFGRVGSSDRIDPERLKELVKWASKGAALDVGCALGHLCNYLFEAGCRPVYGVDISEDAINACQAKMKDISDHFAVINPEPSDQDIFFGGNFDIVIGIQSIYHLSNTALKSRLLSIYKQMKPGALIYLTMMGNKCYYYNYSKEYEDGLRVVNFKNDRIDISNYYVNFTYGEEDLLKKLCMFKRIHVGYYDQFIREDEGSYFHYTFVGQKV